MYLFGGYTSVASIMNGAAWVVAEAPNLDGAALLVVGVIHELEEQVCILVGY